MMSDLTHLELAAASPTPPRYRGLVRIGVICAAVLVVLAAVRVAWGLAAERALARAEAELRAAGFVLTEDEIVAVLGGSPELPMPRTAELALWPGPNLPTLAEIDELDANAGDNAAVLWQLAGDEAFDAVELAYQGALLSNGDVEVDLSDPNFLSYLQHVQPVLKLVRRARAKLVTVWPPVERMGGLPVVGPVGADVRRVAQLLANVARAAALRGDYAEAADLCCAILAGADAVRLNRSGLGILVGQACDGLATSAAIEWPPARVDAATAAAVRELIDDFLLPRPSRRAVLVNIQHNADYAAALSAVRRRGTPLYALDTTMFRQVMQMPDPDRFGWVQRTLIFGEPQPATPAWTALASPRLPYTALAPLLSPAWQFGVAHEYAGLSFYGQVIMGELSYADVMADERLRTGAGIYPFGVSQPMFHWLHFENMHWSAQAKRRLAAVRLAVWLYEGEHGALPASLEALVPEYLPRMPTDPFTDGEPFRYVPNGPRPVVYSLGANGVDDGGLQTGDGSDDPDYVFPLDGKPIEGKFGPVVPPALGPVREDDRDVEDDGQ